MRLLCRHRIERSKCQGHIMRRRSDGTLWTEGHGGYAQAMSSLFGSGNPYYFTRVRRWNHQWVTSRNIVWEHNNASDHEFVFTDMKRRTLIELGRLPD